MNVVTSRALFGGLGLLGLAVVAIAIAALSRGFLLSRADAGGSSASAVLHDLNGNQVGMAQFTQIGDKVQVQVEVRGGVAPGFHGFHVHAVGRCDPADAFMSAAGHLNPAGRDHADHAGDQPILYVNVDGTATLSFTTDRYAVEDLFDADGSALIIHVNPDNYANIPTRYAPAPDAMTLATGDAGGRVACGLIQR